MSATTHRRRLTQLVILAVTAATTVSLAACGNSSNENTGKPSTSASPTAEAHELHAQAAAGTTHGP